MEYRQIHLRDEFPFLGEEGRDPILQIYRPTSLADVEPQKGSVKRKSLLICPGGSYCMCSKRESEPIALNFLSEGMNVFILTYSVAPNRFPVQLCEVAAAMELIHRNSFEWDCDPNRIAIMGFSAGGHLAAHYANAFDCEEVRAVFPESKGAKASLLIYPVITAEPAFRHTGSFEALLGHLPDESEIARFSCEKLVKETTPPAFLWHMVEDGIVPVANSLLYAEALAAHKIPFELHVYPFGGHGLATVDEVTCPDLKPAETRAHRWFEEAKAFLKERV